MFVVSVPRFCMETKFFLAFFGHIFVIIGTTTLSIERRNVENELKNQFQSHYIEDMWHPFFVSISTTYKFRRYIHEISAMKHRDRYCHNWDDETWK